MAEIELKPCPFCGSKEVHVSNPRLRDVFLSVSNPRMAVICFECGAALDCGLYLKAPYDKLTDEHIREIEEFCARLWNRRTNNGR
jgi:hypothetical protein